jgi:uncharacterized protein YgiM (DUF1202 family)
MKMNCWLIFGAMVSASLCAQQVADPAPAAPAGVPPATVASPTNASPSAAVSSNAPAAKSNEKKSAPKKKAQKRPASAPGAELKTVPLVPGPAVVDANHVNVRGQPRLKGEVVTRLSKGQAVTVIEEIVRNNSAADEPSAWAKILLPTNTHAWVHSSFINQSNKTVLPKKLNVRSGPGENYSVLGLLVRGDAVTELGTKGTWMEIEPPANAYAFMAAQYLKQEAPSATPTTPTEPAAQPAAVTEPPAVAAAPTETPAATQPAMEPAVTNAPPETASTNAVQPAVDEPPPKRVVLREGIVKGTVSIQAPTPFALFSPENGRMIDYLLTTSPNLDLRRYKGLRIIVTGEEGIEERWGNTPVITIQKIQVVE